MNKLFLTMTLAFVTMFASAQIMVITTIEQPEEGVDWEMSNITDNMGVGYVLNDKMTVGLMKNGEEYDIWGRYNINFMYVIVQAPTDSTMMDNASIGVGYSLKVWKELYVEPSYMMSMKENDGGKLRLGVAFRF